MLFLAVASSVTDLNYLLNRVVDSGFGDFGLPKILVHAIRGLNGLRVEFAMSYFGTVPPNPWVLVLDALEKKINRHSYETWLKPTRFSHSQGPTLFVRVPNPDFCHIGEKYGDLISEAIENLGLEYQDVEFVTDEEQRARGSQRNGDAHPGETRADPAIAGDGVAAGALRQQRFDWDGVAQLNSKYTFD